jgi:hypothetical protein
LSIDKNCLDSSDAKSVPFGRNILKVFWCRWKVTDDGKSIKLMIAGIPVTPSYVQSVALTDRESGYTSIKLDCQVECR